ncbi:cytochrome c-type biogenesis protein [Maricaulis sp.]|uniref:cytochrome c-type biogenesis protein n=1 Tax=Maricaulis sp. TaxID=1486257 RepID=UPI0025C1108B|nr:cytochrome c-type biogenesis protein [Maricaulis sp.]
MTRAFRILALVAALLCLAPVAQASPPPDERMDDAVMETRARDLYRELRCVVCQSQSIDESNAALAADMRIKVRERLLAGDSNAEVRAWVRERYGDYVLMSPPVQANTLFLWLLPFIALIGGGTVLVIFVRQQARRVDIAPDADEDAELARLREQEGQS